MRYIGKHNFYSYRYKTCFFRSVPISPGNIIGHHKKTVGLVNVNKTLLDSQYTKLSNSVSIIFLSVIFFVPDQSFWSLFFALPKKLFFQLSLLIFYFMHNSSIKMLVYLHESIFNYLSNEV